MTPQNPTPSDSSIVPAPHPEPTVPVATSDRGPPAIIEPVGEGDWALHSSPNRVDPDMTPLSDPSPHANGGAFDAERGDQPLPAAPTAAQIELLKVYDANSILGRLPHAQVLTAHLANTLGLPQDVGLKLGAIRHRIAQQVTDKDQAKRLKVERLLQETRGFVVPVEPQANPPSPQSEAAAPAERSGADGIDIDRNLRESQVLKAKLDDAKAALRGATTLYKDIRLELGRKLVEARELFPRSGPRAAGWGEHVKAIGISQDTALNYMRLAGWAEQASPEELREKSMGDAYREMGIGIRAKKALEVEAPTNGDVAPVPVVTDIPKAETTVADWSPLPFTTKLTALLAEIEAAPQEMRSYLRKQVRDVLSLDDEPPPSTPSQEPGIEAREDATTNGDTDHPSDDQHSAKDAQDDVSAFGSAARLLMANGARGDDDEPPPPTTPPDLAPAPTGPPIPKPPSSVNKQQRSRPRTARAANRGISGSAPDKFKADNVEWYTPPELVESARRVMGQIDLDPASSVLANETVNATRIFTKSDDGLAQAWTGKVFCNPPHGNRVTAQWTLKLIAEDKARHIQEGILVVPNSPQRQWFHALNAYPMCVTHSAVDFWHPDGWKQTFFRTSSAIVYFGHREKWDRFKSEFQRHGRVLFPEAAPVDPAPKDPDPAPQPPKEGVQAPSTPPTSAASAQTKPPPSPSHPQGESAPPDVPVSALTLRPIREAVLVKFPMDSPKLSPATRTDLPNGTTRYTAKGPGYVVGSLLSVEVTCPPCPMKGHGCSAQMSYGRTLKRIDAASRGHSISALVREECRQIDALFGTSDFPPNTFIRLHISGDAGTIEDVRYLAAKALKWKARGAVATWAYTHSMWRTVARDEWGIISIFASAEQPADVALARSMGYAIAYLKATNSFPNGAKPYKVGGSRMYPCPFEVFGGAEGNTCVECGWCFDDRQRFKDNIGVGFGPHGPGKEMLIDALEGLQGGEMDTTRKALENLAEAERTAAADLSTQAPKALPPPPPPPLNAPPLWALLGLSKEATAAEIKSAFRIKALQHHPDRNPGDATAAERFRAVREAYDTLSAPMHRTPP